MWNPATSTLSLVTSVLPLWDTEGTVTMTCIWTTLFAGAVNEFSFCGVTSGNGGKGRLIFLTRATQKHLQRAWILIRDSWVLERYPRQRFQEGWYEAVEMKLKTNLFHWWWWWHGVRLLIKSNSDHISQEGRRSVWDFHISGLSITDRSDIVF